MADVFLSYASTDGAFAGRVEQALSAGGLSVWWDQHLGAGESYQSVITRELEKSAAVVVLWTPASVASEWVYSEARRAHRAGKLVQVRSPDVAIDDLPPPFDALHCPLAEELESLAGTVRRRVTPGATDGGQRAGATATNLPSPVSRFLGREADVAELVDLVRAGARLVTLTGPGGTGKTRLAVETARRLTARFGAGVWWVPLASLRDPALVLPTIASVLGTTGDVADRIGTGHLLLLLDNLEQVVSVSPQLAELLTRCPGLVVLATSRVRLAIPGEREVRVAPMRPDESVALFVERSGLEPSAEVEELCARLDRLPLAVELAAARARTLGARSVLDRLSTRLDLLRGGRDLDPRQQTLRETIAWSDELLTEEARVLFRRLSLFIGGWTIEAAEQVLGADLDVLAELVEHSLVRRNGDRFAMLETIRAYAADGMAEEPDRARLEEAFWRWALDLVETEDARIREHEQRAALGRLDDELDNLRAAFWLSVDSGVPDAARRFAQAAAWFLARRGFVAEGRAWRTRSLDCPGEDESLHGWILLRLTTGSWASASGPGSAETLLQVEGMGQRSGDEQLVAATLEWRGLVGDDGRSETYLDEAARIYRRLGLLDDLARLAINRTAMALNRGEDEGALETADEAIALTREQGNRHGVGVSLANKAIALALLGRVDAVPAVLIEADEAFSSIGESFDYFLLAAVAAHLDVLEDRIDGTTALLLRTIDRAFDREDYSAEPSDERLLAPVRAQVAVLDAGISTPGVDQDSDLGPADALHRWLRARGR